MLRNLSSLPASLGFKSLFNRYSNALVEKPYKTKMLTAGVLGAIGDCLCQTIVEKKSFSKNYDFQRTFNFTLIGTLISAPMCHLWYMKGAPAICQAVSTNKKLYPYISLIADQTLIATSSMAVFLFISEYLRDFSVNDAVHNVRRKFKEAIMANYKVWPPIILFNFLIVPPHFRVLFTNCCGFFWGIYLSYFQYNK